MKNISIHYIGKHCGCGCDKHDDIEDIKTEKCDCACSHCKQIDSWFKPNNEFIRSGFRTK